MSADTHTQPQQSAPKASGLPTPGRSWVLPVSFLFLKAAGWLVVSSVLGLIASIKFHSPEFLADSAWLTYGRVQAAAVHALVYGFCIPAGLGFVAWRFARATPTQNPPLAGLVLVGAILWNIGVLVGLVGILLGDISGFANFEMPGYSAPILFSGYGLVAIWAGMAFHLREERRLATSQWFLLAALLWFPWIFSTAALLLNQFPVRGIAQSVVAWWYSSNLTVVWMGLTGIAGITFLGLRFGWRPAVNRNLALFVFWTLVLFGSWTGIPATAPVPAWMAAVSKIASVFLILPAAALVIIFFGKTGHGAVAVPTSRILTLIKFGAIALIAHLALLGLPAFLSLESRLIFTWFSNGTQILAVYGFFSMVMFAVIYAFATDAADSGMPYPALVRAHIVCATVGLLLIAVPFLVGGVLQGKRLADPDVAFLDVAKSTLMFLRISTIGELLLLVGHLLFLVNMAVFVKRLACQVISRTPFFAQRNSIQEVKA